MSGFSGLEFDDAVIERARRGDRRALDLLCRGLAPAVYTLCYRLCRSQPTAEDLTQETFVQVLDKLPAFRGEASLATWVRTIAVSRCMMHFRSAWQRRATPLVDQPEPSHDLSSSMEAASDLDDALARLPDTARIVVWLYEVEGYTHREIATLTGRSESFSKTCLHRARAALRDWLDAPPAADALAAPRHARCTA